MARSRPDVYRTTWGSMEQLTVKNFPYNNIRKIKRVTRPRGNNGSYSGGSFKDIVCSFDIETTNLKKEKLAIMYVWAFDLEGIGTVTGRTWEEFKAFLNLLAAELNDDEYLVIYSHNLNFEYQFLSGIYNFADNEVFATDRRRVLKCRMLKHFEFRCSYQHSGLKLEDFLKKWDVKDQKLTYNYDKRRFPHTPLTPEEWDYILHEVRGLTQAIRAELNFYGDTLITIPLTKTGYIRRTAKRVLNGFSRTALKDQLPTMEVYPLLNEAFRGGNCVDNRYMRDTIITNVHGADGSSRYPGEQLLKKYPIGSWHRANHDDIEYVLRSMSLDRAIIMRVAFQGLKLRYKNNPAPYLMRSKCRRIQGAEFDLGRILKADWLETTITDIDLEIILDQYEFNDIIVGEWWYNRTGALPVQLTELTKELYIKKTLLKGDKKQRLEYYAAKTEIDSLYGLSVQDPCKRYYRLIDGEWKKDQRPLDEILNEANRRAFLSYSYGVWTTAHARKTLQDAINAAGDAFLYADTDSVYTQGKVIDWSALNKPIIRANKEINLEALDKKGKPHYISAWEPEAKIERFKYLGPKRYAKEDKKGNIEITIAGVDKEKGALELAAKGGLEVFQDGFTFREAGGLEAVYNTYAKRKGIIAEGHKYIVGNNCYLQKRDITLGAIGELDLILSRPELWERIFNYE